MKALRVMSVVGARPNFMKIGPLVRAIQDHNDRASTEGRRLLDHYLVHTGQHYDPAMSQSFFGSLDIPEPDVNLSVGSGTHAEQVGRTMIAFEKVVSEWKPDWVVVVGDVNATCACSITAKKERVNVAHIEAGLRSFDLTMPEEINRMVTDRLSDLLFTPDEFADLNLRDEGVPESRIKRVGNIMIDTLEQNLPTAEAIRIESILQESLIAPIGSRVLGFEDREFAVLTLHRPSNVDDPDVLIPLVRFLIDKLSVSLPMIWTLHPRTRKQLERFGLWEAVASCDRIFLVEPLGYLQMLRLNLGARLLLTDSGGLQEECCVTGTPCITLRENTERPVTLRENGGVCALAGNEVSRIEKVMAEQMELPRRQCRPPLWDGVTSRRVVEELSVL